MFCIIIFDLICYRRHIIEDNIRQSFPEKDKTACEKIIKQFQHAFCDQWIETIKLMSISKEALKKRVNSDCSMINESEAQNIYLLLGHQFNWEWSNAAAPLYVNRQFAGFYLPLKNKAFNKLILKIRTRFGNELIASTSFYRQMKALQSKKFVLALIADQSPSNKNHLVWHQFLNRPTAFSTTTQKLIRKKDAEVFFVSSKRIKRGHYDVKLIPICHNTIDMAEHELISRFVQLLQKSIKDQPFNWLWSHRRWKHIYQNQEIQS